MDTEDRELLIAAVACGMNSAQIEEGLGFTSAQQNDVCRTASKQIERAWTAAGIQAWTSPGQARRTAQ